MNLIIGIIMATIITWLNFVIIDIYFGLPESPGVKGAKLIGESVKKRGGDLSGGFFQGNIVCSPDASAGTLLAAISCYVMGAPIGGFIAALLVYIGNRLCADPGYAGSIGAITTTILILIFNLIGITPEIFIVGMLIAITTIQGIHHPTASHLIANIAKKVGRYHIEQ